MSMTRLWPRRRTIRPDRRTSSVLAAALLLAGELEPGDEVLGVSVSVCSAGQFLTYSLGEGDRDITRIVYDTSDPETVLRACDAVEAVRIDATVRDTP